MEQSEVHIINNVHTDSEHAGSCVTQVETKYIYTPQPQPVLLPTLTYLPQLFTTPTPTPTQQTQLWNCTTTARSHYWSGSHTAASRAASPRCRTWAASAGSCRWRHWAGEVPPPAAVALIHCTVRHRRALSEWRRWGSAARSPAAAAGSRRSRTAAGAPGIGVK